MLLTLETGKDTSTGKDEWKDDVYGLTIIFGRLTNFGPAY
jgi:hypothetical protein